jgi:hypothetical protein
MADDELEDLLGALSAPASDSHATTQSTAFSAAETWDAAPVAAISALDAMLDDSGSSSYQDHHSTVIAEDENGENKRDTLTLRKTADVQLARVFQLIRCWLSWKTHDNRCWFRRRARATS